MMARRGSCDTASDDGRPALKQRPVVLIVEDEPGDAHLVRIQLLERDASAFRVLMADSLAAADTLVHARPEDTPDVVLLDLNLPDSSGLETVHRIRAIVPDAPVVVLTGLDSPDAIGPALHGGAEDYLVKGGDGQSLRKAVRYAMLRHQRDEDARLAETVFTVTDSGIAVVTTGGLIQRLNPAFRDMTGLGAEAEGRDLLADALMDEDGAAVLPGHWPPPMGPDDYWEGEAWIATPDGDRAFTVIRLHAVLRPDRTVARYVAVLTDITARKVNEEKLALQATHDHLTGLPNRFLYLDRVDSALRTAQRYGVRCSVLYVDLDGFKPVNDTFGHAAGDRVLQGVARRLSDAVRSSDTVARLGGDEFAVLLPDCAPADAIAMAAKVVATLAAPFELPEGEANVSASVGVATFPEDGPDARLLLKAADEAMYAAKRGGKNRFATTQNAQSARLESIS
ncbi:diguanylate cyclase domain-containing protein [Novispirillum sp. DQ9]|uniref:diguanylate cyclase domain-containing protein n=1 Tax=Novispirillum sp. DQ9 TaxID=3398612 RepID=UPI003C7DC887